MRLFVTGGSGFIAEAVLRQARRAGHDVLALVRSSERRARIEALGARVVLGDVLDPASWRAETPDVAIHLASDRTERQGSARYATIDTEGARNLVRAFGNRAHFVYASTIWVYGSADAVLDEASPTSPTTGIGKTKLAVEEVFRAAPRSTILRTGIVYPGGAFGRQFVDKIRRGRYFCPGKGTNRTGVISVVDAAGALVQVAERGLAGVFNLVDDEPIEWREIGREISRALGKPAPRHVPLWLARLVAGKDLARFASANLVVSNRKARDAGISLQFKTFREGFAAATRAADASRDPPAESGFKRP